ncbi:MULTISPECIES: DUF4124 domain-containing protein [Halomonadaceae]|jgi:hypothetical protein|uniref:Uncharacterized protein DUF4124 n=1 Tax=Onishia taeanensis TaxID=284577 RepID=A0A328Y1U2_9GAMM|nr:MULTISPECIES: DUF4124 domain-containing protein [Halomonas]MDI4638105.1 DUF4124 domain-containing protein [Halomonas sp. BMC7]NUJ59107.1 DUF4124 domain-containing protein [Halomonas taeanensis]RAR63038.1 uncharacterized protein DUF4124 [Halomonas taeanensis]|tara:strand:- start:7149 stop:7610 length:462 start_codon:yes stop_codon:yes gene_type:complete
MNVVKPAAYLRHATKQYAVLNRLGVCLVLAGWAVAAQAEIYSWQDETGQWHFADHSPEGGGGEPRTPDELSDINSMRPPGASPYRPLPSARSSRSSGNVQRNASGSNPRCNRLEQRLESIQQQLRAGYEEPRGNRLRAARRELTAAYRRECRN